MSLAIRKNIVGTFSRKLRSAFHAVRIERFYTLYGLPNLVAAAIAYEVQSVTKFSPDIGQELTRIKGFDVNWQRRFDLGHRCYLTICDGRAVGYGWVSPASWLLGLEHSLGRLASDVAFIYDEITTERYRGKKLAPARLAYMATDMHKQGYVRSCQLIADDNLPSQRSALSAGYRPSANVIRLHRFAMHFRFPLGGPPPELQSLDSQGIYFPEAVAVEEELPVA